MINIGDKKVLSDCRIGNLLLKGDFITENNLEKALAKQNHTNELLGEILVDMGVLEPGDLKTVLLIQERLSSFEKAVNLAAGVRQLLGELIVRSGRITYQQLNLALKEQEKTGEKIGEILVRFDFITHNELEAVLKFQRNQEARTPAPGRLNLGEIMVTSGLITREQLDEALELQKVSRKKIGETLLDAGYINPHQLSKALTLQNRLITTALIAVLSLASASENLSADIKDSNLNGQDNKIVVNASVENFTDLKIVYQTSALEITPADILRGYIEVPIAARIEIQNNNLSGYLVVFEGLDWPFKEVIVSGFGKDINVNSRGGWLVQPYHGRDPLLVELSYRIILSEDTKAGKYSWPLKISVSPVIPV